MEPSLANVEVVGVDQQFVFSSRQAFHIKLISLFNTTLVYFSIFGAQSHDFGVDFSLVVSFDWSCLATSEVLNFKRFFWNINNTSFEIKTESSLKEPKGGSNSKYPHCALTPLIYQPQPVYYEEFLLVTRHARGLVYRLLESTIFFPFHYCTICMCIIVELQFRGSSGLEDPELRLSTTHTRVY